MIGKILPYCTFNFNIRTRFEHFRTPAEERNGFSQLLRYGYTTPAFSGFSAMIEGETLYALNGSDEIHPLDQAGRGTKINQLWIQYQEDGLGQLRLGRQAHTLDDHRFIGRKDMFAFELNYTFWHPPDLPPPTRQDKFPP